MENCLRNKNIFLFFSVLVLLLCTSCSKKIEPPRTELALGTICTVNAYEDGSKKLYDEIFLAVRDIEQKMSLTIEDSEINHVNRFSGIKPVQVSDATYTVVEKALEIAKISDGAFDPTIGVLTTLWNIGGDNQRVPSKDEIEVFLPLVNWRAVELNPHEKSIFLTIEGMKLDVGGIAKGYAADVAVDILNKNAVTRAIVDFGGNVFAVGSRSNDSPWRIGIKDPFVARVKGMTNVQIPIKLFIENQAVVTSGAYERFFEENGKVYHHILNPATGYPTENDSASISILSNSSLFADALSTACFVLGPEKALELIKKFDKTEIIAITEDKNIYHSKNVVFELIDSNFTVVDN